LGETKKERGRELEGKRTGRELTSREEGAKNIGKE
jgi:hypothetical protein